MKEILYKNDERRVWLYIIQWRMVNKLLKIIVILLILCAIIYAAFGIFEVHKIVIKQIYPKKYSEYVEKYSDEYDVDSLLIYAIIKAESNFKPDVISKSNAVGLMQLMDATAKDMANKLGMEYKEEDLKNPEINIKLGVKYFSTLYDKYKNIPISLTAYNAGSGNVNKWISEDIISSDGSNVENIPFRETNNYVRKILRDYEIYKEIYK